MMIMMPSGSRYCSGDACGYFFWGPHGHDGIWHIALIQTAFNSVPFNLPIFSGVPLSGYNYLLDLILFLFSRLGIPPLVSYFKIVPLAWFMLFTVAATAFARTEKNRLFMPIFLFLIFFAGSFSYVFTLWHGGTLWGSSSVLSMQAAQTLTNPQFAFSLVVLLCILLILRRTSRSVRSGLFLGLLVFLAFGLKFYGGVIAVTVIGCDLLLSLMKPDERIATLRTLGIALAGAIPAILLFYDPFSSRAGSTFSFAPFAMVHAIIEDPHLFYLKDQVNARYFLQTHGWGPKLVRIELMTTALFLFFNFGIRTIGLLYAGAQLIRKAVTRHDIAVLVSIITACSLTILFIQKGEWWNTIQFFYYALFLLNIFTARALADLLARRRVWGIGVMVLVVVLTVPYNLDIVKDYASFPAPAYMPDAAVRVLAAMPAEKGAVLAAPYDKQLRGNEKPLPLYEYDDTSYIPAFSGNPAYIADDVQLRLLGVSYEERKQSLDDRQCAVLQEVTYLFDTPGRAFARSFRQCGVTFKKIQESDGFTLYSRMK